MTEDDVKKAFAEKLFKFPNDAFKHALELVPDPDNVNLACRMAIEWPKDSTVLNHLKDLRESGEDINLLPNKTDLARAIWSKMEHQRISNDDFTKLAKLYAEVRGYIAKQDSTLNIKMTDDEIDYKLAALVDDLKNA